VVLLPTSRVVLTNPKTLGWISSSCVVYRVVFLFCNLALVVLRRAVVASDSIPGLGSGVFLGGGYLVVLAREFDQVEIHKPNL
jgi:hypothetical protein